MLPTIKEIAAAAQVSCQAVSAVLNNKTNSRVSAATRARILEITRERGYRVHYSYKLMHGQRTHTIAIIFSMLRFEQEDFMKDLVLGLMNRFNSLGYGTYFNNAMTNDSQANLNQIKDLVLRGTEHFIFMGAPVGHQEIAAQLERQGLSYIGFKSEFTRNLGSDSVWASEKIIRYFLGQGRTNFKLVLPEQGNPKAQKSGYRFKALQRVYPEYPWQKLLRDYTIPISALPWTETDFSKVMYKQGYQVAKEVSKTKPLLSALFFLSDHYALGAAAYFHQHGIQVGSDILLAGFNNIDAVRFHVLPISSAQHRNSEIINILAREALSATPAYSEKLLPIVYLRPEE